MRTELLAIPGRRETILPELVSFFKQRDRTGAMLEDFVTTFSGTEFKVPGPEILRELRRDEQIVADLRHDDSAQKRLELLRKNGVTYTHVASIWAACEGRSLEPPPPAPGRTVIDEAAFWIGQYRSQVNDIIAMFSMNALERQKAVGMAAASRASAPPTPAETLLSPAQKKTLGMIATSGPIEPAKLKIGRKAPTNTLKSLETKGLIRRGRGGYTATPRGLKVAGEES